MIFVTVGTHPGQFDRLVKRMDEIAPFLKEKVVIQKGFTDYVPRHADSFAFTDDMEGYYSKARLVISQAATTVIEFALHQKPLIIVPRQKRFGEHINDHQVEFAEYFAQKTGVLCVMKIDALTPALLRGYRSQPHLKKDGLHKLQHYLGKIVREHAT